MFPRDPSIVNRSKASSTPQEPHGLWIAEVTRLDEEEIYVKVPRLTADFEYGPVPYRGSVPLAVGNQVWVGFLEGRIDSLVGITEDRNVWNTHHDLEHTDDYDDHLQYHNDARGDAKYSPLGHGHATAGGGSAGFISAEDSEKLAGVEEGATADQTAEEIFDATVSLDGPDSGLDADTVDGYEAVALATEVYTFNKAGILSVGAGKFKLRLPFAATLVSCRASVDTAPTGSSLIVDVNKDGTTIYTDQDDRPTITAGNTDSGSWSAPAVTAFAADSYLTVDIDAIGSTVPGSDLVVLVQLIRSS